MDRVDRLRGAYQEAYATGQELREALREPASREVIYRIGQLVDRRESATLAATALFRVGDQMFLQAELHGLARQQQALEGEMEQFVDHLKQATQQAGQVRSTLGGTRRLMRSGQGGHLLNETR